MSTDEPVDGVALCLSGGGYRAMLFHVGVVWRLHDAGWLERARPRLERVRRLDHRRRARAGVAAAAGGRAGGTFVAPVRALAGRTVDATSVIAGALTPDTISERVAKAYRRHLFGDATLQDLPDHPRFVINATSVQSGVLFRFSKPYMADWRVGRVDNPDVALADAVAASSAFPPVLSPFELDLRDADWIDEEGNDLGHGEYRERAVLSDGGVYDNLGLETSWKACRTVLVSDAGGQMAPEPDPDHDWGRHLFRVLGVIDNQVRSLRKRQCVVAFRNGERLGAYWGIRSDIDDFDLDDALPAPYEATFALATLSTRLARLDEVVQERLINWGYAVCDAGMRAHVDPALPARRARSRIPRRGSAGCEARAAPAGAVGVRPRPAPPLHAGLAGHARRLDRVRPRARQAARPAAGAAPRRRRRRPRARAPADPADRRAPGHAARLQPVARRRRADVRGARDRRAAAVALVARLPVAPRHRGRRRR